MIKKTISIRIVLSLISILFSATLSAQETQRVYLSGTDKDNTKTWDFKILAGRKSGEWTKIEVPSNWETQGFGAYTYGFQETDPQEKGLYRYTFTAPEEWKDKHVAIVFEGAMTDTEVKINGKPAGPLHQGGFYEFKYAITPLLKWGQENVLEVNVSKVSANESVNEAERKADFWTLGGIYRPVYLEIKPKIHIERMAIDAQADGSFAVDVFTSGTKNKQQLVAQVQTLQGENVGEAFSVTTKKNQNKIRLEKQFQNPKLWNPEFPNLYQVKVAVKEGGKTIHSVSDRFGFRTVELRPKDGIYVNGERIVFKGVNRHSFWPESGRTLSRDLHLQDILLMKEMNMNAVRMSHYPPNVEFLDLSDSLGLFVIDELTGWQSKYDTGAGRPLVKELVTRDVNHPSIILWANGNEGGWNRELDGDYAIYDPQNRPVIHPWEKYNFTDTKHYPDYNYVVNSVLYGQEIFFPTEFMHGLYDGGHAAGLDDFWNLMLQHPLNAGGFLWVFSDEGLVRTDRDGEIDTNGNTAPDGILGPYREKEGSFYAIKEIWSPVYIEKKFIAPTFDGTLPLENRYIYTNLDQCRFEWKLVSFPSADAQSVEEKTDAKGTPAALSLAPGEKGKLALNLPENWKQSDALYLTAYDPQDKEVFTWSWALKSPEKMAVAAVTSPSVSTSQGVLAKENGNQLEIALDGISYYFDRGNGYLQKVMSNDKEISLSGGPDLAGVEHQLEKFEHFKEGASYIVQPSYKGDSRLQVKWIFTPGQAAKLEYSYSMKGEQDFMGITFNYPEEKIEGMKWLGRGPYRVWKNRLKGLEFGVWEKDYNNTITGESGWQYPEFKGYHSDMYWVKVENKEAPFTVYSGTEGMFLQMLKPEKPKGSGNDHNSPPFPEGNIGFLHAISPIGTKFQAAERLGPQSQKNMMMNYTPIEGTLWFDFR